MMMVVVMVVPVPVSGRHHDDAGLIILVSAPSMMVMMMVMVVIVELCQLDDFVRRLGRPRLPDSPDPKRGARYRFEQLGERIGAQNVGRGRTWSGRGFSAAERSERRHRSQKASDLLFHKLLLQ